jgi:Family of unknown function (DUF6496)
MHKFKRGEMKSGKGGKGGTVKSRKQAIAIGPSEARKKERKFQKEGQLAAHTKLTVKPWWFRGQGIRSDVRFWHFSDIPTAPMNVRYPG